MTLTEIMYNIFVNDPTITVPNIVIGSASKNEAAREGLLSFFFNT